MNRRTFDILVSIVGLFLAIVLVVAGGLLLWANSFINGEVHDQLAAQQIYFPPADSPAMEGAQYDPIRKYGGQQLTTGAQAKGYADHFIGAHLKEIGGGKTYSQLSDEARADPENAELAGKVESMFRGETLRGLLLNAYAFGTMATIAGIAAICAFVAGVVLAILGVLGLRNAQRVPASSELLVGATAEGRSES